MPDTKRKRVPDHRSDVLKGSLSRRVLLPILGTRKIRVCKVERREREATQRCGNRWEIFCIESDCWLVASGDRRVRSDVGWFRSFEDEASWAAGHSFFFLFSLLLFFSLFFIFFSFFLSFFLSFFHFFLFLFFFFSMENPIRANNQA